MIPPARPFQSGARHFQSELMQRTLFCISIAFLLSISARAQVIETYAESGASYSPPLFPLFPGDTGTKDLQDRHLAAVPSATQLDLAGITANASAKLKSLAIVSDASFSESSTSLIPSVSYDAFTELVSATRSHFTPRPSRVRKETLMSN